MIGVKLIKTAEVRLAPICRYNFGAPPLWCDAGQARKYFFLVENKILAFNRSLLSFGGSLLGGVHNANTLQVQARKKISCIAIGSISKISRVTVTKSEVKCHKTLLARPFKPRKKSNQK